VYLAVKDSVAESKFTLDPSGLTEAFAKPDNITSSSKALSEFSTSKI